MNEKKRAVVKSAKRNYDHEESPDTNEEGKLAVTKPSSALKLWVLAGVFSAVAILTLGSIAAVFAYKYSSSSNDTAAKNSQNLGDIVDAKKLNHPTDYELVVDIKDNPKKHIGESITIRGIYSIGSIERIAAPQWKSGSMKDAINAQHQAAMNGPKKKEYMNVSSFKDITKNGGTATFTINSGVAKNDNVVSIVLEIDKGTNSPNLDIGESSKVTFEVVGDNVFKLKKIER